MTIECVKKYPSEVHIDDWVCVGSGYKSMDRFIMTKPQLKNLFLELDNINKVYKKLKVDAPDSRAYRHHLGGGLYAYIEKNKFKTLNIREMRLEKGKLIPDLVRGFYLRFSDFKEFYSRLHLLAPIIMFENIAMCEESHESSKQYAACEYCNPHKLSIVSDTDSDETD